MEYGGVDGVVHVLACEEKKTVVNTAMFS